MCTALDENPYTFVVLAVLQVKALKTSALRSDPHELELALVK